MNSAESFIKEEWFAFEFWTKVIASNCAQFFFAFSTEESIANVRCAAMQIVQRGVEECQANCVHSNCSRMCFSVACRCSISSCNQPAFASAICLDCKHKLTWHAAAPLGDLFAGLKAVKGFAIIQLPWFFVDGFLPQVISILFVQFNCVFN